MEITIKEESKQPECQRTQYNGTLGYTEKATPSRHSVIEAFAKNKKVKPELVVIRALEPTFGQALSNIEVYVYDTVEALKKFETAHSAKKNVLPVPEPKAEEPAAE